MPVSWLSAPHLTWHGLQHGSRSSTATVEDSTYATASAAGTQVGQLDDAEAVSFYHQRAPAAVVQNAAHLSRSTCSQLTSMNVWLMAPQL